MDSIANFHNNLFAIEIAVFGIIAAAIFVFLQIVYSQFSYREVYGIFKNVFLQLYLIVSTIALLLTAAISLMLSFPELNPMILHNCVVAALVLFSLLLALALFVVFTFSSIGNIGPSRVALLISEKIGNDQIKNYLLKKYGVPAPDDWCFLLRQYGRDFVLARSTGLDSDEKHEISDEERAQIESEKQQFAKTLSENKKTYEKVKKAVEHAQDPLEPLDALMLRAINNVDLATISEIQSVLLNMSANFIRNYKGDGESKEWSPYSGITQKFLQHLTELLRIHLSMCDRQKLDPVKVRILETSEEIADQVIAANANEINVILTFWKEIADSAIGRSRQIFNRVIQLYRGLGECAFGRGIGESKNWLDEIFRNLGWLAERLISRQGIEEKPLMRDYDYFTEYDQLLEALLTFGDEYRSKYPTSYPLIYFDFVDVVFLQLAAIFAEDSEHETEGEYLCLSPHLFVFCGSSNSERQ